MTSVDAPKNEVTISVLEKTFQIKCPQDQAGALRLATEYLNQEMKKIRQSGVVGMERIAIITALNISDELLKLKHQLDEHIKTTTSKIRELQTRIDDVLTKSEQLELNTIEP